MQDKQEQQAKAKITVEFPDGKVETFESDTIAVVATNEGGTHALVYTKAPLTESVKLLNGLNSVKRRVLNSHPILSLFGEKLAERVEGRATETVESAFKNSTGGGVN